jgi:hypothetical protein
MREQQVIETKKWDVDKSTWGEGPWQHEPDRLEWRHAGLPCLARRGPMGQWCGYAAVSPGHPLHGVAYSTEHDAVRELVDHFQLAAYACSPDGILNVHGGITYSDFCHDDICHVPAPGEPDNVFWFGFDTGHAFDYIPGMAARWPDKTLHRGEEYRTLAYVQAETNQLAEQLARLGEYTRKLRAMEV